MKGKFAKVFDMPDGNQVLVQKLYDVEEDLPAIIASTGMKYCHSESRMHYENTETRDKVFDNFTQELAESWRKSYTEKFH